ncbi:MAG: substrate-binding domain-containing protein [Anaerolineae bacterium]|nr:substrate-binding domain-containing protein [Phycisphaerae bacterium]
MMRAIFTAILVLTLSSISHAQATTQPTIVRCAVINGMMDTDFWPQVAARFEKQTGIKIQTVAFGEKQTIDRSFRDGGIDLITMHSSDKIINLVADGLAMDPQPWCRNELIIVGPTNDPAGIKGMTSAGDALRKLAASGQPLVVHASLGAQGVLRAIVDANDIRFDPKNITTLFEDRQREVLKIAAEKHAYTMIGRIPFLTGKLSADGMGLMVAADEALRRPYVVAVANPNRVTGARVDAARKLAQFLRSEETQKWIAEFGKDKYDHRPLFFSVEIDPPK